MSNAIFPDLPGLTWDITRTPEFSTTMVTGADGGETPIANWAYPLWRWTLVYEILRDDATDELRTLMGFFLNRYGKADDFLFDDVTDNAVVGQQLGIGDGSTTGYQCIRAFDGFVEPVKNLKSAPTVYLNGIETTAWTISDSGLITFTAPPASGAIITADLSYYWRVRFDLDAAEFNQFAYQLWEFQECKLVSKRRQ